MFKKILSFSLCFIIISTLFCGCTIGSSNVELVQYKGKSSHVPSGVVATEGDMSLEWDAERCALAIRKGDEVVWASMPLDQYLNNTKSGTVAKHVESHIIVDYKDYVTNAITTSVSHIGALEDGRIYSYLVDGGIRLLYCFDKECFAIPVIYRLKDGCLDVILENAKIYESGNEVYKVSILPYSSGIENTEENRILVPDGSGMIMNCDTNRVKREYVADVYGDDAAESNKYKFIYEEKVALPVFATSQNDKTFCTIITKGEAAATLNAVAGDSTIGYSYAYTSFKIRGSETVQIPQGWGSVSLTGQYSDIARDGRMQLRIAILGTADSGFINVADYYREYLKNEKGLKKINGDSALYLDIPMALSQREFIFGFPKDTMKAVTTYDQAKEIISDVKESTGIAPVVRLNGVQSGGMEIKKIAGGFKLEKVLGNKKSLAQLLESAKKIGAEIYPDFDITRFSKSGGGFTIKSASAKAATSRTAVQYFHSISTGAAIDNAYTYALLSPRLLPTATEKLVKLLANGGFNTVSVSSLGNNTYSDYDYSQGYVGADFVYQANSINKFLKKNKIKVMYESANQYAALGASHIMAAPLSTSAYNAEDEWIPFYQIVFKGYVPMSSASLTVSDNSTYEMLKAVQCGVGLTFTACGTETTDYATSKFTVLSAGSYENNKEFLIKNVEKTKDALKQIENNTIKSFAKTAENVYTTTFENGIQVVVNYGDTPYENIPANDFVLINGGV